MKIISSLLIVLFALKSYSYTGEIIKSYPTPAQHPTGLTYDGKNIWLADRKTDLLYCINPENGNLIRSIESPGYWPMGLAWDGANLWNADIRGRSDIAENLDGMIHKINPLNGNILKTITAPSPSPRGLTWDGKYLWCTDDRKDMIIQFSAEDGTTICSFKSPSENPQGIAYDGKYLWISDRVKNEIYMVDPNTGYVILITKAPDEFTRGLSYVNNTLWATDFQSKKIYQLKVRDGVKYIKTDKIRRKLTFSYEVKNFGPGLLNSLDVHLAIPKDRVNQSIIGESKYITKPEIIKDQWGQETALFKFNKLASGKKAYAEISTIFDAYNVRYFIYPEEVGSMDQIPKEISNKYLADNEKYQINSEIIQNTLKEVVGDEKNAYWIIRKLHQYLISHLHYVMDGAWDTAPTVLRNGHGSCSEYSFTYIALCKAAGVPARYVGAAWLREDDVSMDEVFHRWVEVYLPGYGWVPSDVTDSDKEWPRDQAFTIGYVSNKSLISTESGGDSYTMEWTYNANCFFETQPKTNLNIEYFGDWEIIK